MEVMPSMYGLTRGALTLIGAAVAGFLLWLGADIVSDDGSLSAEEHWSTAGLVAAAGLTMALSQLLGGWTKWGFPRVSGNVFLIAFLPVLITGSWILAAAEPGEHWLGGHVRDWSEDIGIDGLVGDLTIMVPAVAFAIGLVFGFTFDTTGPRARERTAVPADAEGPIPAPADAPVRATDDDAPVRETDDDAPVRETDDRRVHIREGKVPPESESPRTPPESSER